MWAAGRPTARWVRRRRCAWNSAARTRCAQPGRCRGAAEPCVLERLAREFGPAQLAHDEPDAFQDSITYTRTEFGAKYDELIRDKAENGDPRARTFRVELQMPNVFGLPDYVDLPRDKRPDHIMWVVPMDDTHHRVFFSIRSTDPERVVRFAFGLTQNGKNPWELTEEERQHNTSGQTDGMRPACRRWGERHWPCPVCPVSSGRIQGLRRTCPPPRRPRLAVPGHHADHYGPGQSGSRTRQVRDAGIGYSQGELTAGSPSAVAPAFDAKGRSVAALTFSHGKRST